MVVIAIEGISGSGKSTFADAMVASLKSRGIRVAHLSGMQTEQQENPINEFIKSMSLTRDRFLRLPIWAESFLLISNMSYNNHLIEQQDPQIVIRENYLDALQAYQLSRAEEDGNIPLPVARNVLQTLSGFSLWQKPVATYWIRTDLEIIEQRLRFRQTDRHLPYSDAEKKLQQNVAASFERLLADRSDVVVIFNDSSPDELILRAEKEAEKWSSLVLSEYHKKPLIYVAGALYTPAERAYLEELDRQLKTHGYRTFLPHRDSGLASPSDAGNTRAFFENDVSAIVQADGVVAVIHGSDVDSGTAWEIGYAYALAKPVLGLYEDTRYQDINLMILNSAIVSDSIIGLIKALDDVFDGKSSTRSD